MYRYSTSDIDIPELLTPTKRNEFGSMIRKIWTKISLVKLGTTLCTSKIPFMSLDEPGGDVQEIYKSKSESATYSFKFDKAEPLLPKENTSMTHKDLKPATAAYSLPNINNSELFIPSTSLKGLFQANNLIDPCVPCSSKQIPRNGPESHDDELSNPQQHKCRMQILRLSEIREDNSAAIWRTDATPHIPQEVIKDDLYLVKPKLQEVFGHDVEIPSTGPEAGKVITSKAYVPVLTGFEDFSCSAYYINTNFPGRFYHNKAVQADLSAGVRRDTIGTRVTPFGWLYLEHVADIEFIDYRVSN